MVTVQCPSAQDSLELYGSQPYRREGRGWAGWIRDAGASSNEGSLRMGEIPQGWRQHLMAPSPVPGHSGNPSLAPG
jgi:hypothetical protein